MSHSFLENEPFKWRPLPQGFRDEAGTHSQAVLLETSRRSPEAKSYLFVNPIAVWEPRTAAELRAMFKRMDEETARGRWVAGYLTYEAGYALEPKLAPLHTDGPRMAWMGVFDAVITFDHTSAGTWETHGSVHAITEVVPKLSDTPESYTHKVQQVHEWIAAGETYQANLTMETCWPASSGRAMYDAAMAAQPVEYGAWLRLGTDEEIISASPELFFGRNGSTVQTRPMKGTATRGRWPEEDEQKAAWLAADEKNCAENLMIVDLLRNDLGRLCEMGSVRVDRMFTVERFPTLLQMTSEVSGELRSGVGSEEIFRALFPCGSIVGAPKIRTMELLHKLEQRRRGVYTGAIGWQGPGHKSTWSVAIRTIHLRKGEARMGVGSGIVWDSVAEDEFDECRTKCAFLHRQAEPFELIETMLWDGRLMRLDRHVARMERSATYFDIPFDEAEMRATLEGVTCTLEAGRRWRVRITMAADGIFNVTTAQLQKQLQHQARVLLVYERTSAQDIFLFHKTTRRKLYDRALDRARAMGCVDALFCDLRGDVTEGAIHNVFVNIDDEFVTPPLSCGVLPGVVRAEWMELRLATERRITMNDLRNARAIVLTNSVQGAVQVSEIVVESGPGCITQIWCSDRAG